MTITSLKKKKEMARQVKLVWTLILSHRKLNGESSLKEKETIAEDEDEGARRIAQAS